MTDEAFDENRELCGDGNCLGVVVDGKCNVCGLASDGSRSNASSSARLDGMNDRSVTTDDGREATSRDATALEPATDADEFDDDRQLCPDGACTGLIGSDGKCKECGRSAAS